MATSAIGKGNTVRTSLQMRRALLAFGAVALWACGGGGSSNPPPAAPTTGSMELTNGTSSYIDEVYVTPSTSATWGGIQNGSSIAPSAVWTLNSIPPDTYDAKLVIIGAVSRYNAYSLGFPITAGTTSASTVYSSSFTGSLRVVNGSSSSITSLYVVPSGAGSWGSNQLSTTIPLSGVFVLANIPSGSWDVQCVHYDASTNTGYGVSIASISSTTVNCP